VVAVAELVTTTPLTPLSSQLVALGAAGEDLVLLVHLTFLVQWAEHSALGAEEAAAAFIGLGQVMHIILLQTVDLEEL
jgi:hypothetical protein